MAIVYQDHCHVMDLVQLIQEDHYLKKENVLKFVVQHEKDLVMEDASRMMKFATILVVHSTYTVVEIVSTKSLCAMDI